MAKQPNTEVEPDPVDDPNVFPTNQRHVQQKRQKHQEGSGLPTEQSIPENAETDIQRQQREEDQGAVDKGHG